MYCHTRLLPSGTIITAMMLAMDSKEVPSSFIISMSPIKLFPLCANNRFLLSSLTHLPRNNLVFYGIREEAASSPEAAVRDVIKRKVLLFSHSVYSTIL